MSKEKRKSSRVPFNFEADIVMSGKSYTGSIQDVSEEGVQYLLTSLSDVSGDFVPDKSSNLVIKDPSGKKYKLNCEVKWYLRGKGSDNTLTMGMKVTDPPAKYKELILSITNGEDKSA